MVSLSSNASINHPPHPALFYQNMTLNDHFPNSSARHIATTVRFRSIPEVEVNHNKEDSADVHVLTRVIIILKDKCYILVMIIQLFFYVGASITFILFKTYAKSCGIPEHTANMLLAILGIGSTLGRCVFEINYTLNTM